MNSLRSALTAALTSQIIPTIRGIRVTSKNELAPTTEALTRGTAFTQNRGHSRSTASRSQAGPSHSLRQSTFALVAKLIQRLDLRHNYLKIHHLYP